MRVAYTFPKAPCPKSLMTTYSLRNAFPLESLRRVTSRVILKSFTENDPSLPAISAPIEEVEDMPRPTSPTFSCFPSLYTPPATDRAAETRDVYGTDWILVSFLLLLPPGVICRTLYMNRARERSALWRLRVCL